ncbi:MAG: S1/P1 nuclease [Candidatus Sumerlaeaceae bacterium]
MTYRCNIKAALVALALSVVHLSAFAWGAAGHMVVAHVADDNLTSAARTQVQELLSTQTMADVSSWADDERSRHREQAGWHYIDWELKDGSLLAGSDSNGTILDALTSQGKILADPAQDKHARKKALMYVIHFVGDMHQPLHCADNYDKGGNNVKVNIFGRDENLHRTWDGTMLNEVIREEFATTGTSIREFATIIGKRFADEATTAVRGTVNKWALDSHKTAKNVCYSFLKNDPLTSLTVTLGPDYYAAAKPVIQRQLAIGGRRLAQMLNECLDASVAKEATVEVPNQNQLATALAP